MVRWLMVHNASFQMPVSCHRLAKALRSSLHLLCTRVAKTTQGQRYDGVRLEQQRTAFPVTSISITLMSTLCSRNHKATLPSLARTSEAHDDDTLVSVEIGTSSTPALAQNCS